ncbi:hypothetical protein [Psychrobacillus sp. FSL H8-0487]|uniref:hypothetical protein n=1 Tax=Psychrobacillus sp. FSL H8-0487 TaxID=2921391 RepID=UPI0030FCF8B0
MQETFEKVIKHDELFHDEVLPRLKKVEEVQEDFRLEMAEFRVEIGKITASQTSLELTVMKDGQQTRDLLGKFVDHYFSTDDKKLVTKEKVTMRRLSRTEKIILGFFAILGGSGGVIAGVITIMEKFQ